MKLDIKEGKYIVAVSGGVDSMALLHMLHAQKADVIVAHLDHGIRDDSSADTLLVKEIAGAYGYNFEFSEASLGANSSEATAREARYKFLESMREKYGADMIITAHHLDDVLETAIINMLRGTGRKGLSSISNSSKVFRPLLNINKEEIIAYSKKNNLKWNEDSTNANTDYLRNYVRHSILTRFNPSQKAHLLKNLNNLKDINDELDFALNDAIKEHANDQGLDRQWFSTLPYDISREVLASWLRRHEIRDFDHKLIEKLTVDIKTANVGKRFDVRKKSIITIDKKHVTLTST